MNQEEADLPLLLSGFRKGAGYGAVAGFLAYAGVLLSMDPAAAGPVLGLAAGMIASIVGGAFIVGLIGAYVRLTRNKKS